MYLDQLHITYSTYEPHAHACVKHHAAVWTVF